MKKKLLFLPAALVASFVFFGGFSMASADEGDDYRFRGGDRYDNDNNRGRYENNNRGRYDNNRGRYENNNRGRYDNNRRGGGGFYDRRGQFFFGERDYEEAQYERRGGRGGYCRD